MLCWNSFFLFIANTKKESEKIEISIIIELWTPIATDPTVNPIKTLTPRFIVRAVEKMKKKKKEETK